MPTSVPRNPVPQDMWEILQQLARAEAHVKRLSVELAAILFFVKSCKEEWLLWSIEIERELWWLKEENGEEEERVDLEEKVKERLEIGGEHREGQERIEEREVGGSMEVSRMVLSNRNLNNMLFSWQHDSMFVCMINVFYNETKGEKVKAKVQVQ
ncbi:hypothetical protein CPB84DRAFT_1858191 [Gymnopilus junonius]|uniref:Uncharacterized protein n=1 Tax=Gymnopilus junonius TaxID=109634 RepID=A0A9P5N6P0_GYMJU|nr:hypothetical protein CPB84DRAFT_1858191 [Gymnopilus junonius]